MISITALERTQSILMGDSEPAVLEFFRGVMSVGVVELDAVEKMPSTRWYHFFEVPGVFYTPRWSMHIWSLLKSVRISPTRLEHQTVQCCSFFEERLI